MDVTKIISNPVFIILAGAGAVFIVMGLLMLKNPPRKINEWYGYRTAGSKKSQARWDFAQQHASRFMMRVGQILIIISVPAAFNNLGATIGSISAIVIIAGSVIYMIVNTEKAIKNKFDV